ncbi:hypothetical protein, partial [Paraglaciecola chathamensis]|uniref:hypothetical protein n=1 Tax=Paraglaciecola chathamensis TaxID=368405 RepID=UPI00363EA8BB
GLIRLSVHTDCFVVSKEEQKRSAWDIQAISSAVKSSFIAMMLVLGKPTLERARACTSST